VSHTRGKRVAMAVPAIGYAKGPRQETRSAPGPQPQPDPAGQAPIGLAGVLDLQRRVGNSAVTALLRSVEEPTEAVAADDPIAAGAAEPARLVTEVLREPGQALAAPLKDEMEARLGAEFPDVRVHVGSAAHASAAAVGARAYTSGSHVVIGAGSADKHTLAHELTHVIQQRSGSVDGTEYAGLSVSDPSDRFEQAAESNATRAMSD
jgi:hypothetical protein